MTIKLFLIFDFFDFFWEFFGPKVLGENHFSAPFLHPRESVNV